MMWWASTPGAAQATHVCSSRAKTASRNWSRLSRTPMSVSIQREKEKRLAFRLRCGMPLVEELPVLNAVLDVTRGHVVLVYAAVKHRLSNLRPEPRRDFLPDLGRVIAKQVKRSGEHFGFRSRRQLLIPIDFPL